MKKPAHVIGIFLQPGEFYFGDRQTRIRTLLGSCVAITLWHPGKLIGGMCHYMLPERPGRRAMTPDGRYGDEAFSLLLREIAKANTRPHEYEVKMFGGANMFPSRQRCGRDHIGLKNTRAGKSLVQLHGLRCKAQDVGGAGHRNVIFDIWSGHVWVRRVSARTAGSCGDCEERALCAG